MDKNPNKDAVTSSPLEMLIERVRTTLSKRSDWNEIEPDFNKWVESCKLPTPIMGYAQSHAEEGFNKQELDLMAMALLFRRQPTDSSIQRLPAILQRHGFSELAGRINHNAAEEIGTGKGDSHQKLLSDSLNALLSDKRIGSSALGPMTFPMAQATFEWHRQKPEEYKNEPGDYERFITFCKDARNPLPSNYAASKSGVFGYRPEYSFMYSVKDKVINTAPKDKKGGHIANIDCYTPLVEKTLAGIEDPKNMGALSTCLLELATRETTSASESFISAWHVVAESLSRGMERDARQRSLAWSKAHLDEHTGRDGGWDGAAEEVHSKDAIDAFCMLSKEFNTDELKQSLQKVTMLNEARKEFWDMTCDRMAELRAQGDLIKPEAAPGEKNFMGRIKKLAARGSKPDKNTQSSAISM